MTTTEHADQPADAPIAKTANGGLIYPGMGLLFVVLICCFTAWGVAADLTTPMVAGFKQIFDMNTFQASLVQLAYFGAYYPSRDERSSSFGAVSGCQGFFEKPDALMRET